MSRSVVSSMLTESTFSSALDLLGDRDPDLDWVMEEYGRPPFWQREPGFPTLVHIILEQQVSLASAKAAYDKLGEAVQPLTPAGFLTLDDTELRRIGFSRQKTSYCRILSEAIIQGELDLPELAHLSDHEAQRELVKLKGIGPWTANIYLLMALRRPDIWPVSDLAIRVALQKLKNLNDGLDDNTLSEFSEPWRPWRAVAARILWHYYLSR